MSGWGIYGLIDPRTGVLMYIGKSVDIQRRYEQHLNSPNIWDGNAAKAQWIGELRRSGLKPGLIVLRSIDTGKYSELDEAERDLIRRAKEDGLARLNITSGGSSRAADRSLNSSQDDWMELGTILRRVRRDLSMAAQLACHIDGRKSCDGLLKALRTVDLARSSLDNKLLKTFPKWDQVSTVFYGRRDGEDE